MIYDLISLFCLFCLDKHLCEESRGEKGLTQEVTRVRQELDAVSKTGVSRVKLSSIQPLIIVIMLIIIFILYHLAVFSSIFFT